MADTISSLPDVILQHILCFIPIKFAIRTSVLSKRWRDVWCDIPSLAFDVSTRKLYPYDTITQLPASVNETLARYTAPAMKQFRLKIFTKNIPDIDRWIDFAMSRKVENLSLDFPISCSDEKYKFPDSFYVNSSIKQLTVEFHFDDKIPRCSVSWTSLKNLSLRCCKISDESMANILSGCPVLESLTLYFCDILQVLDLSKSLRLRTLQVNRNLWVPGPTHIIAPHIHYLRLTNSELPCTLVDVASLNEANLDICYLSMNPDLEADFLQEMVLKMLEKLHHAEKLTFGGNVLQILSLAELRGVPFPIFKVKVLILETEMNRHVIPGIERMLQNSPDLKKLTIRERYSNSIPPEYLDHYLNQQGLNPNQCWRSKDGVSWKHSRWDVKHVVSLVELVLKTAKTFDKIVLLLKERHFKSKFDELLQTLSHNNNVSIALSTVTSDEDEW